MKNGKRSKDGASEVDGEQQNSRSRGVLLVVT